jgi:hypothetical protein
VDLTWPLDAEVGKTPKRTTYAPGSIREPGSETRDSGFGTRDSGVGTRDSGTGVLNNSGSKAPDSRYREEIEPIHRRISELKPFLLSASQSGSPDVYSALEQTLATLEASLVGMSVPASEVGQHQLLIAATRTARKGLEPGFSGDRLANAQKAIPMFDGAMAAAVVVSVP